MNPVKSSSSCYHRSQHGPWRLHSYPLKSDRYSVSISLIESIHMEDGTSAKWADETAADLFARVAAPRIDVVPCHPGLSVGETLELFGEPGTGKTAMLMECVIRTVLPACAEGHTATSVVVDTEGGFDVARLAVAIQLRLRAAGAPAQAHDVDDCLGRVHVMECFTPRELIVGLAALRLRIDDLLRPTPSSTVTVEPDSAVAEPGLVEVPRLLVIDSISTFQWLERSIAAQVPGADAKHPSTASAFSNSLHSPLSEIIRALQARLSIVWSRCPEITHEGGREFPMGGSGASLSPTFRLRLRRLPSTEPAHQQRAADSDDCTVLLRFQTMQTLLDRPQGTHSLSHQSYSHAMQTPGAVPRHELHVTMGGVHAAAQR